MQATGTFKTVINDHLQSIAETDALFAATLAKPKKNIDDCVIYILNEVKKSGQNGFADEEVFKMAVHYYDEDNIEIGTVLNARVVVNHHIEAKKTATTPTVQTTQKKSKKQVLEVQPSLFQ